MGHFYLFQNDHANIRDLLERGSLPRFASLALRQRGRRVLRQERAQLALAIRPRAPARLGGGDRGPKLKGSIGEGPNHSNFLHQSSEFGQNSFKIQELSLENSKISEKLF